MLHVRLHIFISDWQSVIYTYNIALKIDWFDIILYTKVFHTQANTQFNEGAVLSIKGIHKLLKTITACQNRKQTKRNPLKIKLTTNIPS